MSGRPDVSARPVPWVERWAAVGLVLVAVATVAAWAWSGRFEWTVWADRDLVRSTGPWASLPTAGAELSFGEGARIPGGALHQVWWALLRLGLDATGVWRVQLGVAVVSALTLGAVLARRLGPLPGALAVVVALAHPLLLGQQLRLWNPAWSVGPATLVVALVVVGPGRRRWAHALALGVLVALGAQAHLSMALVGAVVLVGLLWRGAPWGPVLAGVALPYVPFLVAELRGAGQLAALLSPGQVGTVVPTVAAGGLHEAAVGVASMVGLGGFAVGLSGAGDAARGVALLAFALVVAVGAARSSVGRGAVGVVGVVVLAYAAAPGLDVANVEYERFLVPLVPWVAVVVAVGAERWLSLGGLRAPASVACVLTAGWLLVAQRGDLHTRLDGPLDAVRLARTTSVLTELLGPPSGWLGRVAWLQQVDDGRSVEVVDLVQFGWLSRGVVSPASGPCAVVVDGDPTGDVAGAAARGWLVPLVGEVAILAVRQVDARRSIVQLTSASGRCPSTVSPRYLLTPDEARVAELPQSPGLVVPDADGTAWQVVAPRYAGAPAATAWRGLVRVVRTGDDVVAELHANPLRGRAWNAGPWVSERVVRPRLVARAADGQVTELPWAPGRVGVFGVLTPLSVTGPLPAGAALSLEYEVDDPLSGELPPGVRGTTISVPLDPGAPRPPG